jgi:hypothetical protein
MIFLFVIALMAWFAYLEHKEEMDRHDRKHHD